MTNREERRRVYAMAQGSMVCDHFVTLHERCKNTPARAPRVVVPSVKGILGGPGHQPLKMFTTLHYCELHKGGLKIADVLVAKVKADFELTARRKVAFNERAEDFRPDFEHAFIEWVLTTTPDYRAFLAAMGEGGMMRAAMGAMRLAG